MPTDIEVDKPVPTQGNDGQSYSVEPYRNVTITHVAEVRATPVYGKTTGKIVAPARIERVAGPTQYRIQSSHTSVTKNSNNTFTVVVSGKSITLKPT